MSDASVTIVLILLIGIAVIGGVFFLRLFLRWIDRHTVPAVYTPQVVAEEKAKALRTLEAAHGAYEGSLAALKEQPANPNLRQEALRLEESTRVSRVRVEQRFTTSWPWQMILARRARPPVADQVTLQKSG